mgnify:CR=1 FL=1
MEETDRTLKYVKFYQEMIGSDKAVMLVAYLPILNVIH